MNKQAQIRALRMDALRIRASLERAQVNAGVIELRSRAARWRQWSSALGDVGAIVGGHDGWAERLVTTIARRPWLAGLALGALRSLKRRPWLAAVTLGGAALSMALTRKRT